MVFPAARMLPVFLRIFSFLATLSFVIEKHIVLIDGHHLMYRAYYAIPRTMRTSQGEQTNAIFGVASMLMQILKTEEPDGVLFCFDEGDETFRHEEYDEYKAGRAETPDEFYTQIPRILELIETWQIPQTSHPGFEADDLLCTYALKAVDEGCRVTIVTGDRDAFQLASEKIRIAIPSKGYAVPEYMDAAAIEKKYGVTPKQIASYKGLVGDSSDNLKGVQGIGPKAAEALLQEYGDLASIYQNIDAVKPSWKEKLLADKEQAFFCERMATLVCDAPMSVALNDVFLKTIDLDPVFAFYRSCEFSLLTKRLQQFALSAYGKLHMSVSDDGALQIAESSASRKTESASSQLSLL